MKSISGSFKDFNFIINTFKFASMNWVLAMINNSKTVSFEHFCKFEKFLLPVSIASWYQYLRNLTADF